MAITSPSSGQVFTSAQTVTLTATASDDSGIARVEFLDGGVLKGSDTTSPYTYLWSISSAANGSHSWTARAFDTTGASSTSSPVQLSVSISVLDLLPPSTPTGLAATVVSCSRVDVSWSASTDSGGSGLAGYRIYRNGALVGTTGQTFYSDTSALGSSSYSYNVRAFDGAGNTSSSSASVGAVTPACTDTTPPTTPTGLAVTTVRCDRVSLAWNPSTDSGGSGLAGYDVFRDGVLVGQAGTTSFTAGLLKASTTYSFRVRSFDDAGNVSGLSAAVSATTTACSDTTPPSVPTGLAASSVACSQVSLTWSPSSDTGGSGVAGYKLYRGGAQIATIPTNAATDSSVAASTSYSYAVAAYDAAGNNSSLSSSLAVATPACSVPPVAKAGSDVTGTVGSPVTLNGSGSYDPDGSIVSYAWTFGDGTTGSGSTVSHTYASAGTYTATLTVTDNSGLKSSDSAIATIGTSVSTGPVDWTKRLGAGSVDVSQSVTTDGGDNILLGGYFSVSTNMGGSTLSSAGGADLFLAKYSAAGQYLWSRSYGGSGDEVPLDVSADPGGAPIVAGYFSGTANLGGGSLTTAGGYDIFVAKYSATGGYIWSKRFGSTADDVAYAAAADYRGDVFVTGFFTGTVDFGGTVLTSAYGGADTFVAKLDANTGNTLWAKRFSNNALDSGYGLAVDANGDVAITGYFMGIIDLGRGMLTSAGLQDVYVGKLSGLSGDCLWSRRAGGTDQDAGYEVEIDGSGNVILLATFRYSADFGTGALPASGPQDIAVAKYSSTGVPQWSKRLGGSATEVQAGLGVDSAGNVLVSGHFNLSTSLGGAPLTSLGGYDAFVVKYAARDGAHVWSLSFGGLGDDLGTGLAVDGNGYAVVTGRFWGSSDFGEGLLTALGSSDVFLLRLFP